MLYCFTQFASEPRRVPKLSLPIPKSGWLSRGDRVGFLASAFCALHCALLPVAVAALPSAGLGLSGSSDVDQVVVLFASLLGLTTVTLGYRRHRVLRALLLLVPGLLLLWVGAFSGLHDHSLTHALLMTAGGCLLAASHWWNLRLSHAQRRGAAVPLAT